MTAPLVDWGVARRVFPGETESGDRHLIKPLPNGVLLAVVDGLGHGGEAAEAAARAVAALARWASEPLAVVLERCHASLTGTRGVVMSLARLDGLVGTMTWLGVGNVQGVLLRAASDAGPPLERLLLRSGVVGAGLPHAPPSVVPIGTGDTLVFATDGLDAGFAEGLSAGEPPQRLADRILARCLRGTDDALVLVVRYTGRAP